MITPIAAGWYGIANVKWLTRIEVVNKRFLNRFMGRDYVTIREVKRGGKTIKTAAGLASRHLSQSAREAPRANSAAGKHYDHFHLRPCNVGGPSGRDDAFSSHSSPYCAGSSFEGSPSPQTRSRAGTSLSGCLGAAYCQYRRRKESESCISDPALGDNIPCCSVFNS